MKKTFIILPLIIVIIATTLVLAIKFLPLGTVTYHKGSFSLEIPRLSYLQNIKTYSNETTIKFKTFRSKSIVKKEIKKTLNNYEKKTCNNKNVYYDQKNNITITNYKIKQNKLFNEFYIKFFKGDININSCSKITDPTKLRYVIQKPLPKFNNLRITPSNFKYLSKDNNIYNVFYEYPNDILFYTGTGVTKYMDHMLQFGWISMDDIISYLDYQVINNNATKETDKNNKYVLYKNNDFSLLKCTTSNKDIYIEDTNFKFKADYCK